MAKEGFPPISNPLPPISYPLPPISDPFPVPRPDVSTFEKDYSWLRSFWENVLSLNWTANLLPVRIPRESPMMTSIRQSQGHNMRPSKVARPNPPRKSCSGKPIQENEIQPTWLILFKRTATRHQTLLGEEVGQMCGRTYLDSVGQIGV